MMMKALWFAAASVGFASMLVQLSVLREFLGVFGGNELVLGMVMGCWLLLTGLGSYAAGRLRTDAMKAFEYSLFASAVLLPLTVYASRTLAPYLLVRGEVAGPFDVILIAVSALAPYCLLCGCQITLACILLSQGRGGRLGLGYALDSTGSVFGGALFTFSLVSLSSFDVAYVAAAANLASLLLVSPRLRPVAVILALFIAVFASSVSLQDATDTIQYPGMLILASENTRYGSLTVGEYGRQVVFFENGIPLFSSGNAAASEETVHYALPQRPNPRRVLLIGGGVSGTLAEVLKYPVERVDYVELNPETVRLAGAYLRDAGLDDVRVNVVHDDGRHYLRDATVKYDVIIVDLPEPSTAQVNRFYTAEFFSQAKGALAEGGIFSTRLGSSGDYVGYAAKDANGALYSTLRTAFEYVLALPAGKNIYLASDAPLRQDIGALVKSSGVKTVYVNEDRLSGVLTADRIGYLNSVASSGGLINTDLHPISYYIYVRQWAGQFGLGGSLWLLSGAVLLVVLVSGLILKPAHSAVFAAGFTGMALEVVLLLAFQSMYGFVYEEVGVIVASFMAGMAAGAYYSSMRPPGGIGRLMLCAVAYSLIMPAIVSVGGGCSRKQPN
jgi:spermidine synthase